MGSLDNSFGLIGERCREWIQELRKVVLQGHICFGNRVCEERMSVLKLSTCKSGIGWLFVG